MVDWSRFDRVVGNGTGPWREAFGKALSLGPPLPTGIDFLDELIGGLHPGVLNVVAGYSHSGKTLLTRTIAYNNRDKRILWLSADETKDMLAWDLAGSALGVRNFELLEMARDPQSPMSESVLEATMLEHYPNLWVPDGHLLGAGPEDVASVVDQATRMWGAAPELIVFDFMGCLQLDGGDTSTLGLVHTRIHKNLCRMFDESVWLVMSQLNRTGSNQAPTLSRMFGGGEAAIDGCAIGVWRWPEDERSVDDRDILLNVMKAKQGRARPGGPTSQEEMPSNRYSNPHVHRITAGSLVEKPRLVSEYAHEL